MPITESGLRELRGEFPALGQRLGQEPDAQPIAFFDGPGGTQVHRSVIDAMARYFTEANANVHGAFEFSRRTDETIEAARGAMATLINAPSLNEIVYGPSMTTLTFRLSRGIGRLIQPGDELVVTKLDHDANVAPWVALQEQGAVIRWVSFDPADCTLDMDGMRRAIGPKTRLVAVAAASNAVGTVNDIATIARWAHETRARIFVDAVQFAPHAPIDVRAWDADFVAFSVYKIYGPHMGVLWGRSELLEMIPAYKVLPADDQAPGKFETGTSNHEGMAGSAAAIEYLATVGRRFGEPPGTGPLREELLRAMRAIQTHERRLTRQLLAGLQTIPGLRIYGISDPERMSERMPVVSFTVEGIEPRAMAKALGDRGIFAWSGHFYAVHAIRHLGLAESGGLMRIGINHYNTADELTRLIEAIREVAREIPR